MSTHATPPDLSPGHADEPMRQGSGRRDSFVALLAHEIRNPLAPIRSGVALLRSGRLDERACTDALDMMERQLSHLVRLVDDLLASVSVHRGEAPVHSTRVRIADVLNAAVASVQPSLTAKQQVLTLTGTDTAACVDADPQRLAQAFSNLLNSSSKKTPWKGQLRVELLSRDDGTEIRFSDSGDRIPQAELVDIFELYACSPSAIGDSLGIGLALVRGLVEINGGTVDAIDSSAESGTVFVVQMPAASGDGVPVDDRRTLPKGSLEWRSRRVLIVDDNRDAAQTLGALLEFDGHTIRLAHDGPAAVSEAREFSPEVILMDVGLPGFNGLVATREIRRLPLQSRPLIVALTGWGSVADRDATRAAGCDIHLVKPVDYRDIAQALAQAAAGGQEST